MIIQVLSHAESFSNAFVLLCFYYDYISGRSAEDILMRMFAINTPISSIIKHSASIIEYYIYCGQEIPISTVLITITKLIILNILSGIVCYIYLSRRVETLIGLVISSIFFYYGHSTLLDFTNTCFQRM